MLAASLTVGPAIDRFGFKAPMTLGPLFAAAALALIATAGAFGQLVPAMLLLGFGGGALNATSNTLTADLHSEEKHKSAALNLLGVFFGLGALLMPLLVGVSVERAGLSPLLYGTTAGCVLLALACAVQSYPQPKAAARGGSVGFWRLASNRVVLLFGAMLFFQSGNEFLLGGFISTFLASGMKLSESAASFSLTSFWAAILVARLLWGRLLQAIDGRRLIIASAACAAAASIALAAAPSPGFAAAMVPLLGFSLAGIFPTTLGLAGVRFAAQSGSVFGLLFAIALTGGMTLPWLAGQLGDILSIRATMSVAPVGFVSILAIASLSGRIAGCEVQSKG
jgi:fucose permease